MHTRTNNVICSMWNLAAKAKILASQHFSNLYRITFPQHGIFFQNNSLIAPFKRHSSPHHAYVALITHQVFKFSVRICAAL